MRGSSYAETAVVFRPLTIRYRNFLVSFSSYQQSFSLAQYNRSGIELKYAYDLIRKRETLSIPSLSKESRGDFREEEELRIISQFFRY